MSTQSINGLNNTRKRLVTGDESKYQSGLQCAVTGFLKEQPDSGLIHHSDRGSQYTSKAYRLLLEKKGIAGSRSCSFNLNNTGYVDASVSLIPFFKLSIAYVFLLPSFDKDSVSFSISFSSKLSRYSIITESFLYSSIENKTASGRLFFKTNIAEAFCLFSARFIILNHFRV